MLSPVLYTIAYQTWTDNSKVMSGIWFGPEVSWFNQYKYSLDHL